MDNDRIDQIIDKYEGKASSVIQVLLEIQRENRWLPREVLEKVSEKLGVPLSRIQHIVTFYKAFSLVPERTPRNPRMHGHRLSCPWSDACP